MQRRTRTVIVPERSNSHATAQETNLFRDFSTLVIDKRRDPHWGEIALKTQVVLDACWQSAREGRSVRVH
jgi:predicted dehydrogenase